MAAFEVPDDKDLGFGGSDLQPTADSLASLTFLPHSGKISDSVSGGSVFSGGERNLKLNVL